MEPIKLSSQFKSRCSLMFAVVTLFVAINHLLIATAYYVPYEDYSPGIRRSDSEEDDMDQTASAPYQQGGNNGGGGGGSDGYEENEPDGPYGETPRDEEGQADVEKFFDDHLGASERGGMDKENLPTNLRPLIYTDNDSPVFVPEGLVESQQGPEQDDQNPRFGSVSRASTNYGNDSAVGTVLDSLDTEHIAFPNSKLPDDHQITSDMHNDHNQARRSIESYDNFKDKEVEGVPFDGAPIIPDDQPKATGSEVVSVDDDGSDKIYITNDTNIPFKIDDLGGYDPEEDFQEASREIEEPSKMDAPRTGKHEGNEIQAKDITFNDPETDILFNDASETDEVTFARDDPYQTDFEAEIQGQSSNKPTKRRQEPLDDLDYDAPEVTENRKPRRRANDDDSDSSWVNDGIDDMDIPSQAYQDSVLDKAAKQQALAERNAAADDGQKDANQEEPDDQRMPNANYIKDDTKELDDKAS